LLIYATVADYDYLKKGGILSNKYTISTQLFLESKMQKNILQLLLKFLSKKSSTFVKYFKKIILSHEYGKYFGNNETSVFKPPT